MRTRWGLTRNRQSQAGGIDYGYEPAQDREVVAVVVTLREDWVKRSELSQIMCTLS
jgi:hypothetical protein